jgi:hypothetical protein
MEVAKAFMRFHAGTHTHSGSTSAHTCSNSKSVLFPSQNDDIIEPISQLTNHLGHLGHSHFHLAVPQPFTSEKDGLSMDLI